VRILTVNAGSTGLKLHVVENGESTRVEELVAADAVGHRVVHGGERFVEPVAITDEVEAAIDALSTIAPLHNDPALAAIRRARQELPDVPHVAVFDTAFHAGMPHRAKTYAVPERWRDEWKVRRYGFHGLSVQWVAGQVDAKRLVVCHLGGGCSITAVLDGRSVDTTMGFSPLEGVPMATRSGSIDPGALLFVQRAYGLSVDEVDRTLNEESGLEGLSGGRGLRALEAAARDDEQAQLALRVYTYRIATAVAAMAAAAGGLDALVFTAGVGEHSVRVRADVCERLGFLGVELDPELNTRSTPDSDLATSESAVRVLVVAAREELVVARAVRALL
jgi:acetate kinase